MMMIATIRGRPVTRQSVLWGTWILWWVRGYTAMKIALLITAVWMRINACAQVAIRMVRK